MFAILDLQDLPREKGRTASEMKTLQENERGYRPYWSPEHCKKGEIWKYDKPDDMWSIGMIVLEALTGKFIEDKIGWDGFGHTTHNKRRKKLIEKAQGKDPKLFQFGKKLIAKKLYYPNVKRRLKAKNYFPTFKKWSVGSSMLTLRSIVQVCWKRSIVPN